MSFTDPAPHAYPALQFPVHDDTLSPDSDPYRPASHSPLQLALVRPQSDPYRPALQFVHSPAPDTLYFPGPHISAVSLVEPAAHAYPAKHSPEHDADDMPTALPKRPALHTTQLPAPDSEY